MKLLFDTHTFIWWDSEPKDPFDRLLISQTNVEQAILISSDSVFQNYPVAVDW